MTPSYTCSAENGRDVIYLDMKTPIERKEAQCEEFLQPYNITLKQVRGGRGGKRVSAARWALMHWLVEVCGYERAKVGRFLNKHHTSVIHACARHHYFLTGEIRPILKALDLSTVNPRRHSYDGLH